MVYEINLCIISIVGVVDYSVTYINKYMQYKKAGTDIAIILKQYSMISLSLHTKTLAFLCSALSNTNVRHASEQRKSCLSIVGIRGNILILFQDFKSDFIPAFNFIPVMSELHCGCSQRIP